MSELRNYLVEGFIPRDRLRDDETRDVRKNAAGTWVRIGTFRTWGPKSAVESRRAIATKMMKLKT